MWDVLCLDLRRGYQSIKEHYRKRYLIVMESIITIIIGKQKIELLPR